MKTRMQPIKKVFGRFPRLVRDSGAQLKKEINLELVGEETDLDKNLVEAWPIRAGAPGAQRGRPRHRRTGRA